MKQSLLWNINHREHRGKSIVNKLVILCGEKIIFFSVSSQSVILSKCPAMHLPKGKNPLLLAFLCHPERSEESLCSKQRDSEILRDFLPHNDRRDQPP
ncbi:MAG: hypothetical protein KBG49_13335 [Spirochaetes bacterium]|nr:hypothetical protein [Spirochaetota bacterium]